MKVVADYWFSDMMGGHVGIIVGQDEISGERKAYIGVVDGYSQGVDKQRILAGGQKLPLSFLEGLVGLLKPQKRK